MSSNALDKIHNIISKEDFSRLILFSGKIIIGLACTVISCYLMKIILVSMVREAKKAFMSESKEKSTLANLEGLKLTTLELKKDWEYFIPLIESKASDKNYLYFNFDETKIIQQEIIEKINTKIEENDEPGGNKSNTETNFLIHGKAGNGKSSIVRAIMQHVKSKGKECEIVSISTNDILKQESLEELIRGKSSGDSSQRFSGILAEARRRAQANEPNSYVIVNIEEMDTICTEPGMALKILEEFGSVQNDINSHIIFVATTNDLDKLLNVREHSGQKSIIGGAYDNAVKNWSNDLNEETDVRRRHRAKHDLTTKGKLAQEAKVRADKIASIQRQIAPV